MKRLQEQAAEINKKSIRGLAQPGYRRGISPSPHPALPYSQRCSNRVSERAAGPSDERGLQSPTAINPTVVAEHLHCRRRNPKLAAERVQIALNRLIPVRIDNRDLLVRSGRGQLVKTIGMTNL